MGENVLIYNKVSKLSRSIRKNKNNGALGWRLVGATTLNKLKELKIRIKWNKRHIKYK